MKEFIKKYLNQRNRNIISIFIIIFGIGYLINYSFFTPTYVNKYIATNIYKGPANSYFDDENFYQCVLDAYNKENSTELPYTTNLSDEELQSIKTLECSGYGKSDNKKIVSTKGLKKITELQHLDLSSNQLTELDVSNNVALTELNANNNQLTELDVTKNTNLKLLGVYANKITLLDVSNNAALTGLNASNNQLTSIDLSGNPLLLYLRLSSNNLTTIDLSENTKLTSLSARYNQLTSLDVSKNTKLRQLDVSDNQLTELDVSNNNLVLLDIGNNRLKTIGNLKISDKVEMLYLYIYGNELSNVDLSKYTLLTILDIQNNQLLELDVSNNIALKELYANNNKLTELDVSKNIDLMILDVSHNQITSINANGATSLEKLKVHNNKLTELDISENTVLENLYSDYNSFNNDIYMYKKDESLAINKVKTADNSKYSSPKWSSENTKIATVSDNGKIKAVSGGIAKILGEKWIGHSSWNKWTGSEWLKEELTIGYTTTNTVHVVEITSNKYMIDEDNSIIFVNNDNDSDIINNNINVSDSDITVDIDLENKKLTLRHEDDIIKEFNLIIMTSGKYKIHNNDIILYNDMDINTIKNNISINSNDIDLSIDNNRLILKYKEEIIKELDIVSYTSNKYDLSKDKIILQGESNIDLDSINAINCTKELEDSKLIIKYKDNIIKEFNIMKGIEFGELKVNNHNIVLDKEVETSYREFVSNISANEGYSYKIYNNDKEVDENNNIIGGMILKVYYNEEEVDSYNITYDYLEFDKELNIVEDVKLINNIIIGTSIKNILKNIKTNGIINIVDKNNNVISNLDNKIRTGDKFKIDVYGSVLEYTASVKGDSDGDGEIDVMDIIEIVDTIVDNKELDSAFYNASDYNNDNTIDVMDIIDIVDYIVK